MEGFIAGLHPHMFAQLKSTVLGLTYGIIHIIACIQAVSKVSHIASCRQTSVVMWYTNCITDNVKLSASLPDNVSRWQHSISKTKHHCSFPKQ